MKSFCKNCISAFFILFRRESNLTSVLSVFEWKLPENHNKLHLKFKEVQSPMYASLSFYDAARFYSFVRYTFHLERFSCHLHVKWFRVRFTCADAYYLFSFTLAAIRAWKKVTLNMWNSTFSPFSQQHIDRQRQHPKSNDIFHH